nr:MAG TPA: hypothetical protein [Caudoviricetes sp.]
MKQYLFIYIPKVSLYASKTLFSTPRVFAFQKINHTFLHKRRRYINIFHVFTIFTRLDTILAVFRINIIFLWVEISPIRFLQWAILYGLPFLDGLQHLQQAINIKQIILFHNCCHNRYYL